jgi:hypothetical protein
VLADCPRVRHLESLFDRSVAARRASAPGVDTVEAARIIGRWIATQAEAELGRRHDRPSGLPARRATVSPCRAEVAHAVC